MIFSFNKTNWRSSKGKTMKRWYYLSTEKELRNHTSYIAFSDYLNVFLSTKYSYKIGNSSNLTENCFAKDCYNLLGCYVIGYIYKYIRLIKILLYSYRM